MARHTKKAIDALASELSDTSKKEEVSLRERFEKAKVSIRARLNPKQLDAFNSNAKYVLCDGERGSGKTTLALHKMVQRVIEEFNNLGLIIVGERRQGQLGGSWHKTLTEILPAWEAEMGIDHNDPNQKLFGEETKTINQDQFVWVRNVYGGWSQIMMISMPHAAQVEDKIKGPEPGFVVVDEAQTLGGDEYFQHVIQQVGRRPHLKNIQQVYYCANPDGPSHWLYNRFFEIPYDKETRVWNKNYARFHIPVSENVKNLQPGYIDQVKEACAKDPILYRRMVLGEWVDRPSGRTIFEDHWSAEEFVIGNVDRKEGVLPVAGHPVILSYDLGSAHSMIVFEQIVPFEGGDAAIIIDEMDYVEKYAPYRIIVPQIVDRMVYFEKVTGREINWEHISDNSAFNQFRARDGSYDAADVLKISKAYVDRKGLPDRFVIRMKECPKGPGSILARVRMVSDRLFAKRFIASATCQRVIEMLGNLEEDPKEPTKPKETGPMPHRFDAMTYGLFYYDKGRGKVKDPTADIGKGPQVYHCNAF